MTDIFISYSTKDRDRAADLADFFQEKGYSVWWDRDLYAGQEFRDKIASALKDCRSVIVIWTEDSITSRWVMDESETAAAARKLIPVRDDAVQPEQIPLGFRSLHTTPLSDRQGLLNAIKSQFAAPPPTPMGSWEVLQMRAARRLHLLRRWFTWRYAAIAVCVVAVAGYLGFDFLDWMRIRESMEPSDFQQHLKTHRFSLFSWQAEAKLSGVNEWEAVKTSRDTEQIKAYIEKFPSSLYNQFARLRLTRLQAAAPGKYKHVLPESYSKALKVEDLKRMSCEDLWNARNEIFYTLGYCFVTDAGISSFGTAADCPYSNCKTIEKFNSLVRDEIISRIENENVTAIETVEKEKGCRRATVPGACARRP
jgi:hypothetical protein